MREELSSIAPEKLEALDKTMDLFTPPPDMPDLMEPIWFVNGAINEILFSEDYLRRHPMKCIKKRLYDINGSVDEACMEHEIYKKIANYVSKDVAKLCTRLMVDDDMTSDALPDTGIIKSIVTMEGKSDMEKKHASSFQEVMYCRILAFSNVPLSSLYDKSEGFYRRQLIIQVKPKEKCRQDDKNILDRLKKEINGITRWCIDGLERIYDNNFHFTISDRMKKIAEELRQEDNNILSFFDSTGYIRFEKNTFALSRDLYTAYQKWCEDNLEKPYSMTTFSRQLKQSAESLRLNYDKNLTIPGGKKARGYHGICVMINPGFM